MADFDIGLGRETFLYGARLNWHSWDLFYGLAKSVVFGLFIPVISVHMGLRTRGGAEGVGLQTTKAVMFMIFVDPDHRRPVPAIAAAIEAL